MEVWDVATWILTALFLMLFCSFVLSMVCFGPPSMLPIRPLERQSSSADSAATDSIPVGATVVMPKEETCMRCLEPIAGAQCRELRCGCLLHVECLLDWWKESVETRPRREVKSGILQLDCQKCRKTVSVPSYLPGAINVVTRGEIQEAYLWLVVTC